MNSALKELLQSKAPMIVRYALQAFAGWLLARGYTDGDQHALITGNMDMLVATFIIIGTTAWGIARKPSLKAQKIATIVDKEIAKSDPIVLKTPVGSHDVAVTSKGDRLQP